MVSRLSSALLCQIDNSIVKLIKNLLQSNKVKVELKDIVPYFQQHNTSRIIKWKEIDRAICQQYRLDRFNSRQRFVGSIVPNSLPPYPQELQNISNLYLFAKYIQFVQGYSVRSQRVYLLLRYVNVNKKADFSCKQRIQPKTN
ncbi:Hypothetical_protein [Hexamita inflata]|uniref:Hypothetical_protein n=1 Tax=Hexamita inflata TaxID=28002 RepID=A0AA86NJC2_9EUKA|nr:Hypothetical protein HINF_LOCUS7931 [Hexamita inflata]